MLCVLVKPSIQICEVWFKQPHWTEPWGQKVVPWSYKSMLIIPFYFMLLNNQTRSWQIATPHLKCFERSKHWFVFPHSYLGHLQLTQSCAASSGDAPFPLKDGIFGSVTGNSSSGTATGPHDPQCTTGMGVPQYLCLDINQSLSLELVRWPPTFCSLAFCVMASNACSLVRPENYGEQRKHWR